MTKIHTYHTFCGSHRVLPFSPPSCKKHKRRIKVKLFHRSEKHLAFTPVVFFFTNEPRDVSLKSRGLTGNLFTGQRLVTSSFVVSTITQLSLVYRFTPQTDHIRDRDPTFTKTAFTQPKWNQSNRQTHQSVWAEPEMLKVKVAWIHTFKVKDWWGTH